MSAFDAFLNMMSQFEYASQLGMHQVQS
jgi:hypothetical protein